MTACCESSRDDGSGKCWNCWTPLVVRTLDTRMDTGWTLVAISEDPDQAAHDALYDNIDTEVAA